ncbi:hypothetical protein L2E82_20005 [Cichorium intybus]|uniref:Uncharacterized protein n=1 Tax=Cichorium intybus TaxID=13427 RepID=A0ACB9DRR3_CICIN|nr:hypothetical protein L2E82_20005 [Cichorium intybus]
MLAIRSASIPFSPRVINAVKDRIVTPKLIIFGHSRPNSRELKIPKCIKTLKNPKFRLLFLQMLLSTERKKVLVSELNKTQNTKGKHPQTDTDPTSLSLTKTLNFFSL